MSLKKIMRSLLISNLVKGISRKEKTMRKSLVVILLSLVITGFMVSTALACGCGGGKQKQESQMSCQCGAGSCGSVADSAVNTSQEVNNTICPVSGKPIGSMGEGVSQSYNGKTYKLCCGACVKPFKKDPEKYIRKIKTK